MSENKNFNQCKTIGTQTDFCVESSNKKNKNENENENKNENKNEISSQMYLNKVKLVMGLVPTTLDHVSDVLGNFHSQFQF